MTDDRVTIGLPVLQDNGEWEYPGYLDGVLIGFYANVHEADLALHNILAVEWPAAFGVLDVDFAPVGWS